MSVEVLGDVKRYSGMLVGGGGCLYRYRRMPL